MPGTAFVTRPSAIFQGFLLGMFIDGAMRWGLDSILQTAASLVGDGTIGSARPTFITNSTNFAAYLADGMIAWSPLSDEAVSEGYDSFALLIDDVWRYSGTATNYTLDGLNSTLTHYFRCVFTVAPFECPVLTGRPVRSLAYQASGTAGDFTKAATAFMSNATWINPAPGAS